MTENTLLYLTSAAAQVWAALLVFIVMLSRDDKAQIWNQLHALHEQTASQVWWRDMIRVLDLSHSRLQHNEKEALSAAIAEAEIWSALPFAAASIFSAFRELMLKIRRTELITKVPFNLTGVDPQSIQLHINYVSDAVEGFHLSLDRMNPFNGLLLGLVAIVGNLGILALGPQIVGWLLTQQFVVACALVNSIAILILYCQIRGYLNERHIKSPLPVLHSSTVLRK